MTAMCQEIEYDSFMSRMKPENVILCLWKRLKYDGFMPCDLRMTVFWLTACLI